VLSIKTARMYYGGQCSAVRAPIKSQSTAVIGPNPWRLQCNERSDRQLLRGSVELLRRVHAILDPKVDKLARLSHRPLISQPQQNESSQDV